MVGHAVTVKPSAELKLLLLCARPEPEPAAGSDVAAALSAGLGWQLFLSEAQRHGLLPLAHHHLGALESVPLNVREELKDYARRNALRNLAMTQELIRVVAALDRKGIVAVPYKGPALACEAYGNVSLRSFQDLDVIVRPADFARAVKVVQETGYRLTEDAEGRFHASFCKGETLLELHHDVVRRGAFATSLQLEPMWGRLGALELLGHSLPSFHPEDTLLLLCLHGAKHEWQGLLWLSDIAAFVQAHPKLDFDLLLRQAEEADLAPTVKLGLLLARDLLGASLPEEVSRQLSTESLRRAHKLVVTSLLGEPGVLEAGLLPYRLRLELYPRAAGKARILGQLVTFLVRPNAQDRAVPLPPSLRAFHYIVRPLRLAREAVRGTEHRKS